MTHKYLRTVAPRAAAVIGALAAPAPVTLGIWTASALPVFAQSGEAGEGAAIAAIDEDAALLAELGLYEATVRIVSALAETGDIVAAQEHLETSHHAFFEEIQEDLDHAGRPAIARQATAFAQAVMTGASNEEIQAAAAATLDAITAAQAGSHAQSQFAAVKALVLTAGDDFIAGTDAGAIVEPHEYRDAWGFVQVAKARMQAIAEGGDADEQAAAAKALEALAATDALLPSVAPETVGTDIELLPATASWIEFAALQLD